MFQEIILYDWRHICQHCYVANRSITAWLVYLAARLAATILNATQVTRRTKIDETWQEQHPHLVERDKPTNGNRLDKLCRSCHRNKKRGDLKNFWIHFIKLHKNMQEYPPQCVAAFGGVEQIQNGGRCHGNQGTKWPPNKKILRFGRNLVPKQYMMLRVDSHR